MMYINSRCQLGELLTHFNLPRIAVEVGVAEGRLAREMLKWDLQQLHLVDIWENMPFIKGCASFPQEWHDENYNKVVELRNENPNVVVWKDFSHKACKNIGDETCGLIYIDGDHSYEGCKTDIECWYPKLVSRGIMAFHDYANLDYGVGRAVYEFAELNGLVIHDIIEDGKIENKGAWIQKK